MREKPARLSQARVERFATVNMMPDCSVSQPWVERLFIATPSGTEK
jgi:hypothetical protein